jgi:hypothetical protein
MCWGGLGRRGWFHSRLVSPPGGGEWGVGSEVLLEQVQLNFSFQNKFIILRPCGLLVDNKTFSKICVFKSLTGYTDYGSYKKRNEHFLITKKSKVMKSPRP